MQKGLLGFSLAVAAMLAAAVCAPAQSYNWGFPGAQAVPGDYDGDGYDDLAVYQTALGNWYIYSQHRNALIAWNFNWGFSGATPVSGDFDGDGVSDLAVYCQVTGNWYVYSLSAGPLVVEQNWGFSGATPVSGDYNGDSVAELVVYYQPTGDWYVWPITGPEITNLDTLVVMYSNAMVNASNVVTGKIRRNLTPITADNASLTWRTNPDTGAREVLVASFMRASVASNYYHVGQYTTMQYGESWVTVVPELKNLCRGFTGADICLRAKQALGLPATAPNDTIVEYYVNPQYLWRPSRDPEITDREAEVAFRTNSPYTSLVTTNYLNWFQQTVISRNYGMTSGVWNAWPWTQLGYTYDWSKTGNNVAGLSEFVVPGSMLYGQFGVTALVYVVSVTPAVNYAALPDNQAVPPPQGFTINIAPPEER